MPSSSGMPIEITMSAPRAVSRSVTVAPAASYSESRWCDDEPAPDSTNTSKPLLLNFFMELGTMATLASSSASFTTPNFIAGISTEYRWP